jgi:hypothetical protein
MDKRIWWWIIILFLVFAATLVLAKCIVLIGGMALYMFGPFYSSAVVSALTWRGLRAAGARRRGAGSPTPLWEEHFCALVFPLAAALLWFAGIASGISDESMFVHALFFLPVMCGLSFEAPEGVLYVVLLIGVPGQYLAAGALVDALRRGTGSKLVVWATVAAAFCAGAAVLCLVGWVDHEPLYRPLTTGQTAVVVGFHCAIVVALIVEAGRRWRQGRTPPDNQAPHAGVTSDPSASAGG